MRLAAAAFGAALILVAAIARAQGTLADCARVEHDAERLACYDRLVGRVPARAPAAAAEAPPVAAPTTLAPPVPAPAAVAAAEAAPTRIESRIVGHFEGWEPRSRFALENGQVWENAESSSVYHVAESPRVTIERGSFGSYFLSVEGLKPRLAVRRVR